MTVTERNHVRVSGQGSRPMVFAHGFGCDQNMWRFMVPAFESTHKVVLFDQTEISATGHHKVLAIVPVNERAAAPRSFGRWDEGAKLLDFDFVDQDDSVPFKMYAGAGAYRLGSGLPGGGR